MSVKEAWLSAGEAEARAPQVLICEVGAFAAAGGALDEALHYEERLVNFLQRALVFANGGGYSGYAYGATVKFVDDGGEFSCCLSRRGRKRQC